MQMLKLTREPVRLRTCSKYGTESAIASIISRRNEPTAPLMIVLVLELKESLKKQLGLTCQTCNPGHKTKITPLKANQNKLQILIHNQPNIEG